MWQLICEQGRELPVCPLTQGLSAASDEGLNVTEDEILSKVGQGKKIFPVCLQPISSLEQERPMRTTRL